MALSRSISTVALPLLGVAVGCAPPLPDEALIEYARPLAMRVDVGPPPATGPTQAEGFPFDTARITPFLVDPDGPLDAQAISDGVEPTWYLCNMLPGMGLGGCLLSELPTEEAEIPDCPIPDFSDLDPESGELPESVSPCRITTGTPDAPELTIPFDFNYLIGGDIEVTMIGGTPGESTGSECRDGYFGKKKSTPESCIFASQRVSVGPDTTLLAFAQDFGLDLGDQVLPDEEEEPDRNIDIASAAVTVFAPGGEELETVDVTEGQTLTVPADAELEVTISFPAEQLQTYLVGVEGDDGIASYDTREEKAEGKWFRSWGELLGDSTQDPEAVNRWLLMPGPDDEDEPDNGRARLYYVARDSRIGVDWFWFEVEIGG